MRILVLGAGRMGFGAAYDLIHSQDVDSVTVADFQPDSLQYLESKLNSKKLKTVELDVTNYEKLLELMSGHDSCISCIVYKHNLILAKAAIVTKTNFCDLGGNNSVVDAELALDREAKEAGINIIPDCGLAPGMVSIIAAHGASKFEELDSIHIRVGGLPQKPKPPLDYQMVFSVEGLINEYVEKARVVCNGVIKEVESMTEVEELEFATVGKLEAFHTSGGTSTLPKSFCGRIKNLDYKTIRYPGHCEKFKLLIDLGLAESSLVKLNGMAVAPRTLLGKLLVEKLPPPGPDFVLIRVAVTGRNGKENEKVVYEIVDRFDQESGLSAMMRTTSFPASIIAQMMARGETELKGATPQELAIKPQRFISELRLRKINLVESREYLS